MATQNIGSKDFEEKVLKSSKFVLVDFWAPWCMPCRMMAPVLEELSNDPDLKDSLDICKVDTEENNELAYAYQIQSIPNMKLFHNGEIVAEFIGYQTVNQLKDELLQNIKIEKVSAN